MMKLNNSVYYVQYLSTLCGQFSEHIVFLLHE